MGTRVRRRYLVLSSLSSAWTNWKLPRQDSRPTPLYRNTVRRLRTLFTKGGLRMIRWLLWSASISLLGLILDSSWFSSCSFSLVSLNCIFALCVWEWKCESGSWWFLCLLFGLELSGGSTGSGAAEERAFS